MLKTKNIINRFSQLKIPLRFQSQFQYVGIMDIMYYIPKCSQCVHYNNTNARCNLFRNHYLFARFNDNKCGIYGKHFEYK